MRPISRKNSARVCSSIRKIPTASKSLTGQRNGRQAVEQCVRIAENQARRAGYRYADVYEIYDVDRKRDGYRVKGRVVVNEGWRGRWRALSCTA